MAQGVVRVAFVGCGTLANRVHYPSLASSDDVELVGCCDLNAHRLERTSRRFDIPHGYGDFKEMIEELAPGAVYVVVPPHQLFDPLLWMIQQGLAVFLEKPPGVTVGQTRSLV
jgi:virulence factor